MNLKFPVIAGATGAIVLLYCAIKDVSPTALLTAVLQGKAIPASGSAGGSSGGSLPANTWIPATDSNGNVIGHINAQGQLIPTTDSNQQAPKTAPGQPGNPLNESYTAPYSTPSYQVTSV